jgi:4-amino-4-deoxy-L-arabinose transferase-like glycosyltransferase
MTRVHTSTTEHTRIWFWGILLVGGLLRFYRLGFQSLWIDESLQYSIAGADGFTGVIDRLPRSIHPPLSFLVNHFFLRFGDFDAFLRVPSVLFGIASLPLVYLLAQQITSKRAAVFTALIVAISPLHIWYSQDGRMYAQLIFFSLLSTVLLLRALARANPYWWGGYALAVTAGMYTHVFMALGVIAQCLWVLLWHRRHLLAYCLSGVAAVLLYLPQLVWWVKFYFYLVNSTREAAEGASGGGSDFSWMALPYTFFTYGAGFSLGPSVADLHDERSVEWLLQFFPSIVTVAVVFGALLALGLWVTSKCYGMKPLSLCLVGLGCPLAGVTLLSLLTGFPFNARYALVAFPYFCILVGTAVAWSYRKNVWIGTVASVAVLGLSGVSLYNHFFNPYYAKEDVRSAVAFWSAVATHEPLLCPSAGSLAYHYLRREPRNRYHMVGGKNLDEMLDQMHASFSATGVSSAYVLLARDWYRIREKVIRQAFVVTHEYSYPGRVKLLRIAQR